jgi:hypothetical protein
MWSVIAARRARAGLACVGLACVGLAFAGCKTTAPDGAPADGAPRVQAPVEPPPVAVAPTTVLPISFEHSRGVVDGPMPAVVPKDMLAIAEVVRPSAEVRAGPGPQFELTDVVLPQGAKVLAFAQIGVWQQVIVPGRWIRGWIHRQALSQPKANDQAVALDLARLPTVLALHPVDSAQSFPDQSPLKVAIPKGAMFRSLMLGANGALVWLPDTNSVMWISRKDVQ